MATKRQNRLSHYDTDPDTADIAAIHFIKNLEIKPEPIAMAMKITSIPDYRLYDLRKQFEVKVNLYSALL